MIASIRERFDQPGFKIYRNLQELLLTAAKKDCYDEEYDFVVNFYEDDLNSTLLKSQPARGTLFNSMATEII